MSIAELRDNSFGRLCRRSWIPLGYRSQLPVNQSISQ